MEALVPRKGLSGSSSTASFLTYEYVCSFPLPIYKNTLFSGKAPNNKYRFLAKVLIQQLLQLLDFV